MEKLKKDLLCVYSRGDKKPPFVAGLPSEIALATAFVLCWTALGHELTYFGLEWQVLELVFFAFEKILDTIEIEKFSDDCYAIFVALIGCRINV